MLRLPLYSCVVAATCALSPPGVADDSTTDDVANLRLTLRDSDSGELAPGRITVEQRPGGPHVYHFVQSLDPEGSAVPYDVARSPKSFEKHTTVSAHPFGANVPPGLYVVYYDHGPEWRGNKAQVWVKEGEVAEQELPISRWIDMNQRGWYSGDTHVHRSIAELPNVMSAEDLNVALPLSYWIRDAYAAPLLEDAAVDVAHGPIDVGPNRVIWPMNTEYELFSVNGRQHTLGAVFVLNHKQALTLPAPPVAPIAAEARRQSALLDLDKHSWPWSIMLVPIMDVDLFELANNHLWRTEFFFKEWTQEMMPDGWGIETDDEGFTEWGWMDFGFKAYYALLNCGFRLRPSAGTASGVHPVPLGYGRVYVECPDGFTYEKWMRNLDAGRSFVTNGPMLFTQVDGQPPGSIIALDEPTTARVHGSVEGIHALTRIEIVKNGRVVDVVVPENRYESPWVHRSKFDVEVSIDGTSWVAVRCFEPHQSKSSRRLGFAHSSPVHFEMPNRPLRPRRIEAAYFVRRMEEEIERNRDVLRRDELAEFEEALRIYERIAATAINDDGPSEAELRSLVIPADELPTGWQFTDVSQTALMPLGENPIISSHPEMLGAFPRGPHNDGQLDRMNLIRTVLALYSDVQGEGFAILSAFVCADVESAQRAEEVLQDPPGRDAQVRTWRRGRLAVCLSLSQSTTDGLGDTFAALIEARLPSPASPQP